VDPDAGPGLAGEVADPAEVVDVCVGDDDVADVILFLSSARARYITGEIVTVNGGVYMS
jgi:NAD(P)-dependent dehydrogenase (short-subunit alcohol dehydrogenase family)